MAASKSGTTGLASALGLDTRRECDLFAEAFARLAARDSSAPPLRVFEHKNSSVYSVHFPEDIALATSLGLVDGVPEVLADRISPQPADPSTSATPFIAARVAPRSIRDLVRHAMTISGRKVEIYSRSTSANAGSIVRRASASPGTLLGSDLEEEFFGGDAGEAAEGGLLAVKFGAGKVMGIAHVDMARSGNRPVLQVLQVTEDDGFGALGAIVMATGARELLIATKDGLTPYEDTKLAKALQDMGVARTEVKRKDFESGDLEQDLRWLMDSADARQVGWLWDMKFAMAALACIIRFTKLTEDSTVEGRVQVRRLDQSDTMQLDSAACRALNVFPQVADGGMKTASLYGLLNKTKTSMGARELKRWLSRPLQSVERINERLDLVGAFVNDPMMKSAVRDDHLRRMPDLASICRKFQKAVPSATLQDVVRLFQFSVRLPFLCSALDAENLSDLEKSLLTTVFKEQLLSLSRELANFEALVETTIDLEQINNHEYVISPSIDETLAELGAAKEQVQSQIADCYAAVQRSLNVTKGDQLKLERKDAGYCFRLTRKDEKLIRGNAKYIVIDTRKDGVRFTNRELRNLSDKYSQIAAEYDSKQTDLVKKTLEVVATYVPVFEDCSRLLAKLDVIAAFATCATDAPERYCRPDMRVAGTGVIIQAGRHPMVEDNLEGREFIANDVDLRRNDGEGGALAIVTGPNMGGKSTYIRMVAVVTLMSHIGAWVPARTAEIPVTDRILARVGAGDNQLRGVSTFMAEMLETATILRSATRNSLVVIDELGRGTSTYDGFGLAYAIAEELAVKTQCASLFATHFHELTALESAAPRGAVRNLHVTAMHSSEQKLVFLYEVRKGPCDQSFGIHVAEMVGFPESVVSSAKRKAAELETFTDSVMANLDSVAEDDRVRGEAMVQNFVDEFRALPIATMKDTEVVEEVRRLRRRTLDMENPYIQIVTAHS